MNKRIFNILLTTVCSVGMALPASAQQDSVAFAPQQDTRVLAPQQNAQVSEQEKDSTYASLRLRAMAKKTQANSTGSITIRGNVFGGGKMAGVENSYIDVEAADAENSNAATITATVDIYPSVIGTYDGDGNVTNGYVFGGNDIAGDVKSPIYGTTQRSQDYSTKVTVHNTCTSRGVTTMNELYGGGNGYYTYCFTYNGTEYKINAAALAAHPEYAALFVKKAPEEGLEVKVYAADETDFTKAPLATYTVTKETSLTNVVPIIHNSEVTIGDETNPASDIVRIGEVYGGAKMAWVSGDTKVTINSGTMGKVFAGNNYGGVCHGASLTINGTKPATDNNNWQYAGVWSGTNAANGFGIGEAYGGGNAVDLETSSVHMNGGNVKMLFGGGNSATVTNRVNLTINCPKGTVDADGNLSTYNVKYLFAGNNQADMAITPSAGLLSGSVYTVYGGGNQGNMTGFVGLMTNQSDYMYNGTGENGWGNQMKANFPDIKWYADATAETTEMNFDMSKVIAFMGSAVVVDSPYASDDTDHGLVLGNVYGGCRAANVNNGAYVRVTHCDYIKNVYGGCDIAGSVGAKPGYLNGKSGDTFPVYYMSGTTQTKGHAKYTEDKSSSPIPMWNSATWVMFTGGTCAGNIYGGGNGNYSYTNNSGTITAINTGDADISFNEAKTGKPWVIATTLFIEGGTVKGNVYGGGNKAEVGHEVDANLLISRDAAHTDGDNYKFYNTSFAPSTDDTPSYLPSSSFLCIGRGGMGVSDVKIEGDVYGGGKMADVHGCLDILTLGDVDINRLFAGNDISGGVGMKGAFRGSRFSNTPNPITCMIGEKTIGTGLDTGDATPDATKSFDQTELTKENANVYVRMLYGGHIGKLFGGGNGDYTYSDPTSGVVTVTDANSNKYFVEAESAAAAHPSQYSTWLDVAGDVDEAYGGGNNAPQNISNLYIMNNATVTRAFGGGNSATVTEDVNLVLDCDGKRGTQDYVNGTDASKVPNVGLLFAGNNQADMNITPIATLKRGSVQTVYGGGNEGSMLGSWAILTDQSAYMDKGTDSEDGTSSWGKQMETNFKGISWYEDEEETKSIKFDMDKVIAFVGTNITIDSPYEESIVDGNMVISDNPCGLVIGDVYGGCRAANVNNGAYVRVTHCDYIHEIYGGCDIAGSVGATPGTLNGAKDSKFDVHWVDGSTGTRHTGHAKYTDENVSIPMWNAATWVIFTGGTCYGNIYGSGNGDYDYTSDDYKDFANNKPWVIGTTLFIEGGTIKGNIYGGGNKADVGHKVTATTHFYDKDYDADADAYLPSSSFLCIGKADLGRSDVTIENDVFGGGRISDINGTIDILTLQDVTINRLFAGNDISGSIKGLWRGTRFSTEENEICCFTGGDVFANPASSFSGSKFRATNANVYARIMPGAKITQLFGGGNGDYDYSTLGTDKPYQEATWLDVLGHVGTAFGGGNASDVGTSSLWIVNNAQVGTAFAGGNSATVTENAQVFVYCNPAVYGTDNNVSSDGYIINEPEHLASASTLSNTVYNVGTVYGGNNTADMAVVPRVILAHGKVGTVYGGGNAGSMKGTRVGVTDVSGYLRSGLVTSPFTVENYPVVSSTMTYADAPLYTADQKTAFKGNTLYSEKTDCIDNAKFTGLRVDRMYGGCRAANVDFSSYIQLTRIDYMGDVFGGCDIAGSVGAVSVSADQTTSASYAKAPEELDVYKYDVENHSVGLSDLKYPEGTPYLSTGAYVCVTDGTIQGNIFGGGNGEYKYADEGTASCKAYAIGSDGNVTGDALTTFDNTAFDRPWNACSYVMVEGGTLNKNVYLGGNNATIGRKNTGTTYMLGYDVGDYSVFASGLLIGQSSRTPEGTTIDIKGDVFAGGRMADVYGTVDALVKTGVKINRLFAGNDIAGTVTGNGRDGVNISGYTMRNGSILYASADEIGGSSAMTSAKSTYNGTDLTSMTGQVYVRVEKNAEITTLFGGGNGDYTYGVSGDNVTYNDNGSLMTFAGSGSTDAEKIQSAKPFQLSSWLDIKGKVGTVYGGGNAANNDYTHVFVTGDAVIGTTTTNGAVYGGCKSADVNYASTVVLSPFTANGGTVTTPTVNGNVFGGCDISGNVGFARKGRLDIKNYGIKIDDNNTIQLGDAISEGTFTLNDPVKLVTASNLSTYRNSTKTYYVYNKYGFSNVLLYGGTVTGRVFGGGNGLQSADGTSYGEVSTSPTSGSMDDGDDVYSYTSGTYKDKTLPQVENSWVVARNCTVGTTPGSNTHTIFGGGQGAGTRVVHNVDLQIGNTTQETTVEGISYGGSYSGFVNSDCYDHTCTTILGYGDNTQIKGDIYGGSYGNYVRGEIQLNINNVTIGVSDTETAGIYAGNNNAGQPECNASINYVGNSCNVTLYGGGNKAPFYGTTRITFTKGTVGYIYGGGNQAPVYGNTIVEVLGGHVCHDVFGGGNQGGVFKNTEDADNPYGGNTLVIVRDDCLKLKDGSTTEFEEDAITGNYLANRDEGDSSETYASYFGKNDPYADAKKYYLLKPNNDDATKVVKSNIEIEGNVYGGGNAADVEGKATVIIGNKAM